jgi:hypothetical protein
VINVYGLWKILVDFFGVKENGINPHNYATVPKCFYIWRAACFVYRAAHL